MQQRHGSDKIERDTPHPQGFSPWQDIAAIVGASNILAEKGNLQDEWLIDREVLHNPLWDQYVVLRQTIYELKDRTFASQEQQVNKRKSHLRQTWQIYEPNINSQLWAQ